MGRQLQKITVGLSFANNRAILIGFAVILLAWLIINVIFNLPIFDRTTGITPTVWDTFTCDTTSAARSTTSAASSDPGGNGGGLSGTYAASLGTTPGVIGTTVGNGVIWTGSRDGINIDASVGISTSPSQVILQPNTTYYLNARYNCEQGTCNSYFTLHCTPPGLSDIASPTAAQIATFVP